MNNKNINLKNVVKKFLIRRGWHTYYNENYWVNTKTVIDPDQQDYTNYGMDLISAFVHEVENLKPFEMMLMPEISQKLTDRHDERGIIDYYFGGEK